MLWALRSPRHAILLVLGLWSCLCSVPLSIPVSHTDWCVPEAVQPENLNWKKLLLFVSVFSLFFPVWITLEILFAMRTYVRTYVRISGKNSCGRNPLRRCVTYSWGNLWSSLCLKEKCSGTCSVLIPLSHPAESFQWSAVELQIPLNFSSKTGPCIVIWRCLLLMWSVWAVLLMSLHALQFWYGAAYVFHHQSPLTHFVFSSINLFLSMFTESNPAQPLENKAIV